MKNLRILVVDDDKDFAESLAEALELQGHNVEAVYSGEQGVESFKKRDYDIAFMDVKMPGKNGVASFMEIKQDKPDVRVIMMTGYSVVQLLDQAVHNGAWGVLYKPLDMDQVNQLLERVEAAGVLIADDDKEFVASIKETLKKHGYNTFCAYNGQEAVERVRQGGIDVLMLDLQMPLLNGLEVYLELKKTGHLIPTIILAASTKEDADLLSRLSSFEVSGVLVKPFNTKTLLQTLGTVVNQKRNDKPGTG